MSLNASIPFLIKTYLDLAKSGSKAPEADPSPEAPPVSVPKPVEEPAEVREVAACLIVGSAAEVERFQGMAKIMGDTFNPPEEVSEEEGARGCDLLLQLVDGFAPNEFRYDCIPTRIADQGEQFDVYVIRGADQARARFNRRVEQIGGELTCMGPPALRALAYAEDVLARMEFEDNLHAPLDVAEEAFDVGEEVSKQKHRPPSDERYRLRHKYGVTRSQLEQFGVSAEAARYISDRVIDELKAGEGIVEAIENAHKLWAAAGLEWKWIDRLNLRIAAELTVPRMVRDGRSQEEAMSLANTTDAFMEMGWSVGDAFAEAEFYWNAKSTNDATGMKQVKQGLRSARFTCFYDELTGKTQPDVWERPSGAQWVARVAADLCGERNPKTDRLFTLQEAAKQAGTEWQSMTREARLGVRDSFYGTTGGAAWEDEDYFVSTLAKASLVRAHGIDESVADLIVPMILVHAQQGKDLMAAIEAGIRDWQEASKPKSPPPPPGLHEILKLLMDNPAHWLTVLDPKPPVVEEKVPVREEVDLGDYRPMCGCVTCRQSMVMGRE